MTTPISKRMQLSKLERNHREHGPVPGNRSTTVLSKNLFPKCFQKKRSLEEKQLISATSDRRDPLPTFPAPKCSTNSPPSVTTFHFTFPFARTVRAGPRGAQKGMCAIACILFGLAPVYVHKWLTSYLKAKLGGEIAHADFDWVSKSLICFKA